MSANELKAELLENCTTEQKRQFAEILAKECAEEDRRASGHRCWLFVPSRKELKAMGKFSCGDACPKCKKGRIVVEIFKGNFGDSLALACYWGKDGCDFREDIADCDNI